MAASTKRMYDKILNSHTTLNSKGKGTPQSLSKGREGGVKSELRERKEHGEKIQVRYKDKLKKGYPHQSIDDIKSYHTKTSLLQTKNKVFVDKLTNNTPVNYWTLKSDDKIPRPRLKRKYITNIPTNTSKRSVNSNSKSRSSAK